jgi:hypothetical protein
MTYAPHRTSRIAGLCIPLLILASACHDPGLPTDPEAADLREGLDSSTSTELVSIDPQTAAIIASAWHYASGLDEWPIVVGVLDRGRTDGSAVVTYHWTDRQAAYEFALDGQTWTMRDEISDENRASQVLVRTRAATS